jgi:prepilin-type N-terminal cleavage/methylation domain-containing protein
MICCKSCKNTSEEIEKMRNNSGMTIIELMVVIGILAILAGIAIPGFIGWLPNYRLRSAADDVQSTLQNARLRAVRENAAVGVDFIVETDAERYRVFFDNNPENGLFDDPGELTSIFITGRMPPGIILQSANFNGGTEVQFTRRGFPNFGGNVVVTNGTRSETINLTLGGSSSIQ